MDVITATVDARGQSCPGPLVALHHALRDARRGDLLELLATDPGSKSDVPSWAKLSGNTLVDTSEADGAFRYVIRKGVRTMADVTTRTAEDADALRELIDQALEERDRSNGYHTKNKITIIAWDGHLDRIWPTLILSTTAAASGMEVSVFFTFWGLFPLVKPERRRKTGKDWMTKALGAMNPGSTQKAKLSRYNFAGMGPWMLGKVAENYKTPHPTELLDLARDMGVRLIPCQMTMDLMGIGPDDLIDGLQEPIGAATALLEMKESAIQLFI